ncbi:MAG: hypothetical protein HDQ87_08545 [Clostridia bacterium]|nr:hypothetical protein [Clostridia bacterium]
MDPKLIHAVLLLTISQAESGLFCRRMFAPRFPQRPQAALRIASALLPAWLAPLQVSSPLAALTAAVAWNAVSAAVLDGKKSVMPSLFAWNLCQIAALATRALDGTDTVRTTGIASAVLTVVWIALNGVLIGIAIAVLRALYGEPVRPLQLLVHVGANLELAAVGLFVCRALADGPVPAASAAIMVSILLAACGLVLLHIHRGILRSDRQLEEKRDLIQAALDEREHEFAGAESALARARRMRHDYANHAVIAQNLAAAGRTDEALEYLAQVRRSWLEEPDSTVELQAFGRLTGDLAGYCAGLGISLHLGGEVPPEGGISSRTALPLLLDVFHWAAARLAGSKGASIGLLLHGREAFECVLDPSVMPTPKEQQELRSLCGESRLQLRVNGRQLWLRISGRRFAPLTDPPRKSDEP